LTRKKVVVTGGAGFIGSHVVDRLLEVGAEVVAIDDLSVGSRGNLTAAIRRGATLRVGDVRDADLMRRELAGTEAVIHMACDNLRASLGNPVKTHEMNATGTLITCLAAVENDVQRFVYVSSSEAYGSAVKTPMREDHPLLPTTVYGASKAAGELYSQACMRTYELPVVVVRPFNSYGPREHASGNSAEVIPKFASRLLAGMPPVIFGNGDQTRDFTWVEETAIGIVKAMESDELVGDSVNIAFGTPVSISEIAEGLIAVLGTQGLSPQFDEARPGDVTQHWADTSKAKAVLGFEARVPIEEGLERYVEWLRSSQRGQDVEPDRVRNW
jgi:UDP-glucose 4-epimerase